MKGAKRYAEIILMVFPKKNLFGKWAILEPKMAHGYNSGSALKNFFKFWVIKGQEVHLNYIKVSGNPQIFTS